MKIFVASDHAGFNLRQRVLQHLRAQSHDVVDLGPPTADRSDYPDYAARVARQVRDTADARGVLVCGSGLGMCIAANKFKGIRAADGFSIEAARLARAHNDANVICLGERLLSGDNAVAIVDVFVKQAFDGGRHADRLQKIAALEENEADAGARSPT